jgi:hypothetical protein
MAFHIVAEQTHLNVSPEGFRLWAREFYKCRQSFKGAEPYSPVPYYLLCHAIELAFKAVHLEQLKAPPPGHQTQAEVKNSFGHDLIKSYKHLPLANQTLSKEELSLLKKANKVYKGKGFEYMKVHDAVRGFSNFPDLPALDALATAIVGK